ncbi:MAG: hypothetical protein RBS96_02595 [Dehalococcoidales bacterium]|jgi:hypothetical protein|nr:hypothetical protein [Syntrophales bacterium]MDX9802905.1 hypothetical protein [Dehalococcoidales bacterium]
MEEYKSAMYVVLDALADLADKDDDFGMQVALEVMVQDTAEAFGLDDAETLMEMVTREIAARVDAEFAKNC